MEAVARIRRIYRSRGSWTVGIFLAGGIAICTAAFSVVDAIGVRGLPYPSPDQVFSVSKLTKTGTNVIVDSEYLVWSQALRKVLTLAAYQMTERTMTGSGFATKVRAAQMSSDGFVVLGIQMLDGRPLTDADVDAVVVTRAFAERVFGTTRVVGRPLILDSATQVVVGVTAGDFAFPRNIVPDVLIPYKITGGPAKGRFVRVVNNVFVRVAETESAATIRSQILSADRDALIDVPAGLAKVSQSAQIVVTPLRDHVLAAVKPQVSVAVVSLTFLLALGCVSLVTIQFANSLGRRREMSMRRALGATDRRLLSETALDACVVGVVSGFVGAVFSYGLVELLPSVMSGFGANVAQFRVGLAEFAFAELAGLVLAVSAALFPVVVDRRRAIVQPSEGRSGTDHRSTRLFRGLIIVQLAVATTLCFCAVSVGRAYLQLTRQIAGFSATDALTASLAISPKRFPTVEARHHAVGDLLAATPEPDVVTALATSLPSYTPSGETTVHTTLGSPDREVGIDSVSVDYWRVLGTPIVSGRPFQSSDVAGAPRVAVINESLMTDLFGSSEAALGATLRLGKDPNPLTVVGIVSDPMRQRGASYPVGRVFLSVLQEDVRSLYLIASADRRRVSASTLRSIAESVDRAMPVNDILTMKEVVASHFALERSYAALFGVTAVFGIAIAAGGTYGLVTFVALRRLRETAIRLALGATFFQVAVREVRVAMGMSIMSVALALPMFLAISTRMAARAPGLFSPSVSVFAVVAAGVSLFVLIATSPTLVRLLRINSAALLR